MAAEKAKLKVGERVGVPTGAEVLAGQVVEDRGRIGRGGRRLARVEVVSTSSEPVQFEVPVDQLLREVTVHLEGIDASRIDEFLRTLMQRAREQNVPLERAEFASEYEVEQEGARVHIWLALAFDPEAALGLITTAAHAINPRARVGGMTFYTP